MIGGVGAALAVAVLPAPAVAATTVGQLFTPNGTDCGGPFTAFQTGVASGNSYTVPSPGVITSWSFQDGSTTVGGLKLKVGRSPDGINYTIVGESTAGPQTPNAVNTYPARISVQTNDQIGIFFNSGGCGSDSTEPGDTFAANGSDVPPNTTAPFTSGSGARFPVAALVEPDFDRDGFGDDTQDQCPTDASTQVACPPPPQATGPGTQSTPDRTAPTARLSGRASQDIVAQRGSIIVDAFFDEAGTATAGARVSVPNLSRLYRFKAVTKAVSANRRLRFRLKLGRKAFRHVRRALARGRRLRAVVRVVATDAAGNERSTRKTVRLRACERCRALHASQAAVGANTTWRTAAASCRSARWRPPAGRGIVASAPSVAKFGDAVLRGELLGRAAREQMTSFQDTGGAPEYPSYVFGMGRTYASRLSGPVWSHSAARPASQHARPSAPPGASPSPCSPPATTRRDSPWQSPKS